ncbi:hypothetical protein, partial [Flammeovirga sp. OC4]|uniref:hypothetical protein n=1 Tax=Flammeovirga sp. OC4 TaxID=1382345 RepID=UPI0005C562B8
LEKFQYKTLEEIKALVESDMNEWNNRIQKRDGKSPMERWNESPEYDDFKTLGAVSNMKLFWEFRPKARIKSEKIASFDEAETYTYYQSGLPITFGQQTFNYEVLNDQGKVDLQFHGDSIGKKFKVKYDPENLDKDIIALYDAETERFVCFA